MKNASCIVIGGAGGMGIPICCQLLKHKIVNLAIIDIQPIPTDLLNDLKQRNPSSQIVYYQRDVSVKEEITVTFNSISNIFKSIDILINAAGIFNDKNVEITFKVNVFGMIYSTMLGIDLMSKESRSNQTDAIILNIASIVGLDPLHLLPVYSASKNAIVGFSRAYSHESFYAVSGVKIIILCPGATTTSFARQFSGKMIVSDEEGAIDFFRLSPKQRSESVAEHVIHLIKTAKNGSIWISDNGQLTEVNMKAYYSPPGPGSG